MKKKYILNDLLDEINENNLHQEIDFGKPVGREIIDDHGIKEFKIDMVVYCLDNKYSEKQIFDMFMKFVESNDLYCGGSIKELTENDYGTIESSFKDLEDIN